MGDAKDAQDFEMMQFQISTGKGRVIGFFDNQQIFQIVLLDPEHNMQPSRDFAYKITYTTIADSEIVALKQRVVEVFKTFGDPGVEVIEKFAAKLGYAVLADIDLETISRCNTLIESGAARNIDELLDFAVSKIGSA